MDLIESPVRPSVTSFADGLDTSQLDQRLSPVPVPVDDFVARFKVPLPSAILSTPQLRKTRGPRCRDTADEALVPKGSARLAAKSGNREPKPEAQARKILMMKLGMDVETHEPDTASFDEFHTAFALPLPEKTREAMQTYYLSKGPVAAEVFPEV